jgi:DDE_Tnp_1-associated/Transposase DDE domain
MIPANYTAMAAQLQEIRDPRSRRGQRYEWRYLLLIVASAVLAGQQSVRGMAQWAVEQAPALLAHLQPQRAQIPSVATLHRVLTKVPIAELERRLSAYTSQVDQAEVDVGSLRTKQGEVLRGQSVDGKTLCGASQHGEVVHLVSLVRHESGIALAQERVASKIDERKAACHLLTPTALRHTVTTTDALYTQVKQAEQILTDGGHYLMVVKRNQPSLYQAIELAFAAWPPINAEEAGFWQFQTYTTSGKAHGRLERRTLHSPQPSTTISNGPAWLKSCGALVSAPRSRPAKSPPMCAMPSPVCPRAWSRWLRSSCSGVAIGRLKTNFTMCAMSPLAKTAAKCIQAMPRKHSQPCVMASWPYSATKAGLHRQPLSVIFLSMCNMLCVCSVLLQLDTALTYPLGYIDIL